MGAPSASAWLLLLLLLSLTQPLPDRPSPLLQLTGTDIEAACREYFVPDYFKSIESGKISSKDYLPGATVVDGRDAVGPGRKPAVANGADAAATQFMALSTKGATAQIVSLQSEAGAAYKADPAATVNYLVTLPDGSTRYRGTARVVKPNGQTKWFIDTDVFPLDNPKVNYMVVPTRDWRGVVTMALDKKFRKK